MTARPGPVPKTRSSSSPAFLSASHRPLAGAQHLVVVLVEASGAQAGGVPSLHPGADPQACAQRPSGLGCVHGWALGVGWGAWAVTPSSSCQPWVSALGGASQVALMVKNPPASAGDGRHTGLIPGSGRSPGEGHVNPLQDSCLENPMDRGAWWAAVHGSQRVRHE